jgi:hypothetical protein
MNKVKIKPEDNSSNMKNSNKGVKGTNKYYDKAQGNRGAQLKKSPSNKRK